MDDAKKQQLMTALLVFAVTVTVCQLASGMMSLSLFGFDNQSWSGFVFYLVMSFVLGGVFAGATYFAVGAAQK